MNFFFNFAAVHHYYYPNMKAKNILIQIFISALTCAVIIHFAIPKYDKDTVYDMECERDDIRFIHTFYPTENLINLSHDEIHKKRMDIAKAQEEQERQGQILKEAIEEVTIMSEEEMEKEAQRIREQSKK